MIHLRTGLLERLRAAVSTEGTQLLTEAADYIDTLIAERDATVADYERRNVDYGLAIAERDAARAEVERLRGELTEARKDNDDE